MLCQQQCRQTLQNKQLAKKIPDKEAVAEESRRLEAELENMFHATDETMLTTK